MEHANTMSKMLHRFVGGPVFAAVLVAHHVASACSASPCVPTFFKPSADTALPRNVPGFYVSASFMNDAGTPVLRSLSGASDVPLTADLMGMTLLLRPTTTPTVGDYTLTLPATTCDHHGTGKDTTITLKLGPEIDLPVSLGTLSVSAPTQGKLTVRDTSGPCVGNIEATWREIVVSASPAIAAFAPVTTFDVTVDGAWWPGNRWVGYIPPDGGPPASGNLFVFAACGRPLPQAVNAGLELGKHVAVVTAHIAGSDVAPSASVAFTLECPNPFVSGYDGDAGTTRRGDVVDGGTSSDAGSGSDPGSASGSATSGGGCACDHGRTTAATGLRASGGVLLALVLLLRRSAKLARSRPADF
jgi:hypothetical protein